MPGAAANAIKVSRLAGSIRVDHRQYPRVYQIFADAASGALLWQPCATRFALQRERAECLFLADQLCTTPECACATTGEKDIPGDVSAQIAALNAPTGDLSFLAGHVDMTRLAISGHSQGGCVAAPA